MSDNQDPNSLVSVLTTTDAAQAELIRGALRNEGIACEIDGENQGSLSGVLDIHLLVRAIDADRAAKFIAAHESRED